MKNIQFCSFIACWCCLLLRFLFFFLNTFYMYTLLYTISICIYIDCIHLLLVVDNNVIKNRFSIWFFFFFFVLLLLYFLFLYTFSVCQLLLYRNFIFLFFILLCILLTLGVIKENLYFNVHCWTSDLCTYIYVCIYNYVSLIWKEKCLRIWRIDRVNSVNQLKLKAPREV